jgi:hypothetical protein
MYKDRDSGKLYTGPVWDYDLAFDNDNRTYPINSLPGYIYNTNGSVASGAIRDMVTRIVTNDPAAHQRLIAIWNDACVKHGIDEKSLLDYVAETKNLLYESQRLNFKRWKILNEYVHQNPQALGSYDAEVETVENYIKGRITKLDNLINK